MLCGRPPFHAESAASTVMEVLNLDPTPPSQVQSKVSPELENIRFFIFLITLRLQWERGFSGSG